MREEKEKVNKELHLEVEAGDDHVSVGGDDGDVLAHDPLIHVNHVTWRERHARAHTHHYSQIPAVSDSLRTASLALSLAMCGLRAKHPNQHILPRLRQSTWYVCLHRMWLCK